MTDDRNRNAILARRAKFLAAALVATLPACDREKEGIAPDHPTKPAVTDTGAPSNAPAPADAAVFAPCLEVAQPPGTADAGDAAPAPMPCLKVLPAPADAGPKPHPCLKMPVAD